MKLRTAIFLFAFIFFVFNPNIAIAEQPDGEQNQQLTITFNLNGGNIGGNTNNVVLTVQQGDPIPSPPGTPPQRQGYNFNGWSGGNVGSPATGNITLTAVWQAAPQVVEVTFNFGNFAGSPPSVTREVILGNTLGGNMPNVPNREGHTFARWVSNGQTFDGNTPVTMQTLNVTAEWNPAVTTFNVTFNLNGGAIGNSTANQVRAVNQNQTINNTPNINMPQNPTRVGFTFTGWQQANGQAFNASTVVNSAMTVTAQWSSANTVNVTFNLNGGAIGNSTANQVRAVNQNQAINNTPNINMPQNPTRAGFTFTGWQQANGQAFNASTVVNSAMTVTAQWSQSQLTLTFNAQGGTWQDGTTSNIARNINHNQSIQSQHNTTLASFVLTPSRVGHSFDNWFIGNTNTVFTANTIVTDNMTINARWTVVQPQELPPDNSQIILPTPEPIEIGAPLVTEVVSLDTSGIVQIGPSHLYIPEHLGRHHINSAGVSVLPARAALSILFGADPYDTNLFQWFSETSTFVIDPSGHNINITVGSTTMFVNGNPRQILSGEGAAAFPVAAYVDPEDSRLYVPVRAIAEAVGFAVGWNPDTGMVTLTPPTN